MVLGHARRYKLLLSIVLSRLWLLVSACKNAQGGAALSSGVDGSEQICSLADLLGELVRCFCLPWPDPLA